MENIRCILVISRMNQYSSKVFHYGVSLARKYDAKLLVLHLVYNPAAIMATNMPGLFPEEAYGNYLSVQQAVKEQLDEIIKQEHRVRFPIRELTSDRDSIDEIVKVVNEEKVDLIIMPARAEGRLEHLFMGGENEDIIRTMPCSILLVNIREDESC